MRKIAAGSLLGPLALVAATVLVVLLSLQARQLRGDLARERESARLVRPGSYLPALRAPAPDGQVVALAGGDSTERQVLFLYNTACQYCLRNIPAWKEIAARLGGEDHVRVVGVAVDSAEAVRGYAAAHALPYPSVLLQQRSFVSMYRGRVVPQTVVLDGEGLVLHSRVGVLHTPAAVDSVLEAARGTRAGG